MSTCRVCGNYGSPSGSPMIKYSTRHYAHADCALRKWGAAFFDRLTPWQLRQFPALAAAEAGLFDELERRVNALPAKEEIR